MDKSKKFTVSKNAEIEIEEVFRYQYENFGDKRAQKIENSILMFAQKAANNPNFYPPYLNNTNLNRNIRKALIHKTYVLIFEVLESHIHILSLYHGAMNRK